MRLKRFVEEQPRSWQHMARIGEFHALLMVQNEKGSIKLVTSATPWKAPADGIKVIQVWWFTGRELSTRVRHGAWAGIFRAGGQGWHKVLVEEGAAAVTHYLERNGIRSFTDEEMATFYDQMSEKAVALTSQDRFMMERR